MLLILDGGVHFCDIWHFLRCRFVEEGHEASTNTFFERDNGNTHKKLSVGFEKIYFHLYLGKWSNLTNIFQMGWNHQPENDFQILLILSHPASSCCLRGKSVSWREQSDASHCPRRPNQRSKDIYEIRMTWLSRRYIWIFQSLSNSCYSKLRTFTASKRFR